MNYYCSVYGLKWEGVQSLLSQFKKTKEPNIFSTGSKTAKVKHEGRDSVHPNTYSIHFYKEN
jgi:hypothetical protein